MKLFFLSSQTAVAVSQACAIVCVYVLVPLAVGHTVLVPWICTDIIRALTYILHLVATLVYNIYTKSYKFM